MQVERPESFKRRLAVSLVIFGAAGCHPGAESSTKEQRVAQGTPAPKHSAVAFIEVTSAQGTAICSASLVTAQHLLTAAHCVTGQFGDVDCAGSRLGEPLSPESFRVSFLQDLQAAPSDSDTFRKVSRLSLAVPRGSLCGDDLALLTLAEPLTSEAATPLEVAEEIHTDRPYQAIGYGAVHASGTGEGVRRMSSASRVACLGEDECAGLDSLGFAGGPALPLPPVAAREFVGTSLGCPGDSGGPALTDEREILGVLSRGYDDCSLNIFSTANTPALRSLMRAEAEAAGLETPSWAQEKPSEEPLEEPSPQPSGGAGGLPTHFDEAESAPAAHDRGCSHSSRPSTSGRPSSFWLLSLLPLLALRRRQHS